MPFESEEDDLQKLNITIQFVFLSLNFLYVASSLLKFKQFFLFFYWHIQWYKKCWNWWKIEQVMPFENEEDDLQKLNITILTCSQVLN